MRSVVVLVVLTLFLPLAAAGPSSTVVKAADDECTRRESVAWRIMEAHASRACAALQGDPHLNGVGVCKRHDHFPSGSVGDRVATAVVETTSGKPGCSPTLMNLAWARANETDATARDAAMEVGAIVCPLPHVGATACNTISS